MLPLHVYESGSLDAPAVVFLHGAGVSGRMWRPHMVRLNDHHCLAPDLPGHGRSNHVPWRSAADTADLIVELIESRVPSKRVHLVGLSLGGSLAHVLLGQRPDLLKRTVVDGSGGLPWRGNGFFLLGISMITPFLHTRPVIAMLSRSVGHIPKEDQSEIKLASRRAFHRAFRDSFAVQITRAETSADCPTLFVAGERENVVRASNAALAALMPHAVARYVPGTGHGWLGMKLELHQAMVQAWLAGADLPNGLAVETSAWDKAAVERQLSRTI